MLLQLANVLAVNNDDGTKANEWRRRNASMFYKLLKMTLETRQEEKLDAFKVFMKNAKFNFPTFIVQYNLYSTFIQYNFYQNFEWADTPHV